MGSTRVCQAEAAPGCAWMNESREMKLDGKIVLIEKAGRWLEF